MSAYGLFKSIMSKQLAAAIKADGIENAGAMAAGVFGPAVTKFLDNVSQDLAEACAGNTAKEEE